MLPRNWQESSVNKALGYSNNISEHNKFKKYFRMLPAQFDEMARMIRRAGIMLDSCFRKFGHEETVIPVEFKIGAVLFWMGHGGSYEPCAGAACIGVSTLK
eukprot:95931-Rhodomonas_salina.1